ncbi:MAG: putative DNA-binding domain-containing protein [Sediminibacterium sp.]|nr:putative DNA-binding domain-containing protein [Sediminibacterium sp.]
MQLLKQTRQYQSELAGYCRTGILQQIPGIHTGNVVQYRKLVMNVVDDILQNAYPLTYDLLTGAEWDALVAKFFAGHSCKSPQVWYMPKELIGYMVDTDHALLKQYPMLLNLLQFEWLETEMFMMQDIPVPLTRNGDLLFSKLVLNPEHRLMVLEYPVHRKKPSDIRPEDQQAYYLAAHRDEEGQVVFTELSPALLRAVEHLQERAISIQELYQLIEQDFGIQLTETDHLAIIQFIQQAYAEELIKGFAPVT